MGALMSGTFITNGLELSASRGLQSPEALESHEAETGSQRSAALRRAARRRANTAPGRAAHCRAAQRSTVPRRAGLVDLGDMRRIYPTVIIVEIIAFNINAGAIMSAI